MSEITDILPQPFAWVDIPAGETILEDATKDGGTAGDLIFVPAFQIAKYPITVAQYYVFIEHNGYSQQNFWTRQGWRWLKKYNHMTRPGNWNVMLYEKGLYPDHPIGGMSWYEAVAFCQWLSIKTQTNIHLPSEAQWQRAAQGDDGRAYPWGNEWDMTKCNNRQVWKGSTTPVTQYPNGASPYGVMDMCGNVREWCLTAWKTGLDEINTDDMRVSRGGTWNINVHYLRVTCRFGSVPYNNSDNMGFRIARSEWI
jgi:formylglycine-generating enzyme required for sulfatase activity